MVQAANVLIGGGTGFIGRHLVQLLKNGGAKVRVITRNPKGNPDHVSWSTIKQQGLPEGTTSVINLAGRNILDMVPWTKAYKDEVYSSRIETNRLLADAIQSAPVKPKSFIVTSGVGYYPPSETAQYDENWTPPEGDSAKSKDFLIDLVRKWEKASELDEKQAPTTRRVVIRVSVVLGPDGGMIGNLRLPFSLGLGGTMGDGKQVMPWIHVEDLVNMYQFAMINDHVTGVINGNAPDIITNREFTTAMGKALNRPTVLPMPSFVVNLMFSPERAQLMLKGQRVKSRSELLGFRYKYPKIQEAVNQCVGLK